MRIREVLEVEKKEQIEISVDLGNEIMSSWPRFKNFCYLLGHATVMERLSPKDRERVYELECDHFMQTDGANLKQLDEEAWQNWVAAGRPRPH
jgi:hypothetical protein